MKTDTQSETLYLEASKIFTPAAPIDEKSLFAGRKEQLKKIINTVIQRGQHAIVFGERGVGKTSLANVLGESLGNQQSAVITAHINCDSGDSYGSIWSKVFSDINVEKKFSSIGFNSQPYREIESLSDSLSGAMRSDQIGRMLSVLAEDATVIIIIDEFDRVKEQKVRSMLADTIKMLSDRSVSATLVLVGVADTVGELLSEHQSIGRTLVQVHMPRMSKNELMEIILKGLSRLGMKIDSGARDRITLLSRGLPHYTHALSLQSTIAALDENLLHIKNRHVETGIRQVLEGVQESIRSVYQKAVMSSRGENSYYKAILACALAKTDETGYFAAPDVREVITKSPSRLSVSHMKYLDSFCEEQRGGILERIGAPRRHRYRFRDPLMPSFVTMQCFADGILDIKLLDTQ